MTMLRIIEGGAKTGKSTRVREELLKAAEQEEAEGRLLLLVPEQFSFETEREYLDALGLARAGRVRVASFERFAADLFREFGGMAGDYADDAARLTAMKLALQQCRGQLSAYGPLAGRSDFPQQMVGQVAEFKNAGLTGADLELAEAGVGDGPLREKLSDLSLLWSLYEGILGEHYIDGLDSLSRAAMLCAEHRWFAGRKVWLDGFKSFTAVQERLIGLMLSQKAEVTVTLPIGGEDSRFFVPRETAKRLRALAWKAGEQAASPIRLDRDGFAAPELAHFSKEVLRSNPRPFAGENRAVECAALFHEFDEAEFAAARVLAYAREEGYAFEEIAVLVRDLPKYGPLLEAAFDRYDIPFYMDRVESVDVLPLFRFVTHLMQAAAKRYAREELLAMLKCGLLPLSLGEIAAFESYTYVWNVDHHQLLEPFSRHPAGYAAQPMTGAESEELAAAEAVRQQAVGWISFFLERYEALCSWPRALYAVLERMDLPARIGERVLALAKENRQQDSDDLRRSWEALAQLLTVMDRVLAGQRLDLRDFCALFTAGAAGCELGRIPQTLDSVLVGSAERVRLRGKKAVLILGANEREFPLLPSSGGVFTEQERELLAAHGFALSGQGEEALLEERFVAWQALSSPSERLTVTFSLGNLKGEERRPSAIAAGFRAIFPGTPVRCPQDFPPEFFCRTPRTAFLQAVRRGKDGSAFAASAREYLKTSPEYAARLSELAQMQDEERLKISDPALTARMFGGERSLSPSQIEQFYSCRFRYFCRYGLKLKSRGRAELDPLSRGSIIHFLLEEVLSRKDFFTMEEDALRALVERLLSDYLEQAMGGQEQSRRFLYLYRRMSENALRLLLALRAEFAQTEFVIAGLEEPVAPGGRIAPLSIPVVGPDGREEFLSVTGKIDRIDCWEKDGQGYVRVIDYKTGNREFSLDEVAEGLNLQMLLYLFSIWRGGKGELSGLRPAGILYLPAGVLEPHLARDAGAEEQQAAREEGFAMNGLLLNDKTVLCAMEKDLAGRFLPVSMGKNKLKGEKWLAALEDFENLEWYALKLIQAMAGELLAGEIAPNPIQCGQRLPCRYCEFRAICGYETADGVRAPRKMTLEGIAAVRQASEGGNKL